MPATFRERASWCLFDFANSAFVTIMITAFYGRYFTDVLARGSRAPATLWGGGVAVSMALVALSSPILGAVADRSGRKRSLLRTYVAVNVLACAALGLVGPRSAHAVPIALGLLVVANVAFEGAYVFYNAFLPELAAPGALGRLSGYGWAVGYVGGLGCLALVKLAGWVPDRYDAATSETALRVPPAVAIWFALFSLPMLLVVRERAAPGSAPLREYARRALGDVRDSFALLRVRKDLARFFVAYLLFTDALETVIIFTGKFTGDALQFTPSETIQLFLVLNLVAAPGAVAFGFVVDKLGGVRAVGLSLLLWLVVIVGSVLVRTKAQFWPIAVVAAVALGATQSASRAVVVRFVPQEHVGRVFGLMTVVGRASAIVGPTVYGVVSDATGSARLAVASVGVFVVAAMALLGGVDERRAIAMASRPRGA
jgi:UMF1 family MFS transporter